ncbi:hypothetical protein RFI_17383 [Reticulomyxa filosa]|uniref:Methyltransferase domain-containing protein n=1 Tax=Reticulomyxa filosa TaxID=46433 RepID=X6N0P7_RETFI|nr:hypothetical protein RFI_17383 [Reticulomyxa filosa]|eukprot:ETO19845.1 hypothetical protein RFI_17383 [Reticulomyxa filosa]
MAFQVIVSQQVPYNSKAEAKILVGATFHEAQLKFSGQIADKFTDWCCGYIPLVYHYFLPFRKEVVPKARIPYVLDMGCGSGEFIQYLHSQLYPEQQRTTETPYLFGVDISAPLIKKAISQNNSKAIFYDKIRPYQDLSHLLNLNNEKNSHSVQSHHGQEQKFFDIVTCNFVISGVLDLCKFFQTINQVLHPEHGVFYLLTNNPLHSTGQNKFISIRTQVVPKKSTSRKETPNMRPKDMDKMNVSLYRWNESQAYVTFREYYRSIGTLILLIKQVFGDCQIMVDSFVYQNDLYDHMMLPLLQQEQTFFASTTLSNSDILHDNQKMKCEKTHAPYILFAVKKIPHFHFE